MPTKRIILFPQDKGGIGKSDYLRVNGWIIETNRLNAYLIELSVATSLRTFCTKERTGVENLNWKLTTIE